MKILVTGGAGFIGSNFIRYMLVNYNDLIINLDKLTYAGRLENLKDINNHLNYKFVKGDIVDSELVENIVKIGVDVIINFAAESHVDRSIDDSRLFIRTNIQGTGVLLEAARKYEIKRFVQISTDEVYGSLGEEGFFTEDSPLEPSSPYSASKASADMLARAYYKTHYLPVMITRCSNNYGPYQFPEKLIPLFIINALNNKGLPLYGDGLNVRDWIYVEDHCRAVDLVMRTGKPGEVYNIGASNELTNLEITKRILGFLDKSDSLMKFIKDRPGHDRRYALDASKIKRELGWKPRYNFEKGIKETVKWYVENRNWWKSLVKER